jgi:hypothetical protein
MADVLNDMDEKMLHRVRPIAHVWERTADHPDVVAMLVNIFLYNPKCDVHRPGSEVLKRRMRRQLADNSGNLAYLMAQANIRIFRERQDKRVGRSVTQLSQLE